MTNEQIIEEIAMQVYGEEAVSRMIEEGVEIPLHTYQGWAQRGPYRVKKGEHGIECRLWQKQKNKRKDDKTINETDNESDTVAIANRSFYLCKSYLFRADQVEKVEG